MEYILQTDNLSKIYGTKTVLDHVSIHVPKKSIYGLVGKNGAGKTTLMRIICGLTQQSEGSYTLLGKSNDAVVRKNMGMLIEKPGIYEHMTALENLRYFSLLFGIQSKDHHRILEMVGLQNAGKKKASQFSLGMKQRLGALQSHCWEIPIFSFSMSPSMDSTRKGSMRYVKCWSR